MSPLYRGNTPIVAVYRGNTPISTIYRGSTLVGVLVGVKEDFTRADGTLGSNWTDHGPSTDWKLGIQDGRARVLIPEGLIGGFWDYRASFARYNASTAVLDDGFVEIRPATIGDAASLTSINGYVTEVFGRGSNSAATHGMGLRLAGGHFWIVRMVSGNATVVADCGTFQAGNLLRLTYTGNDYSATRNGTVVGTWTDSSNTASKGSGYRSLLIRGDGAKDLLGPRRFSPAIDYVQMV